MAARYSKLGTMDSSATDSGSVFHGDSFALQGEEAVEMVRILFHHFRSVAIATVVIAPVMVFLFWNGGNAWPLATWLGAILSITVLRALFVHRFLTMQPPAVEAGRWAWWYTAGAAMAGITWGMLPWLFFASATAFHQYLTVLVLAAMISATSTVYAAFLPAHVLAAITEIGPLSLWYFERGTRDDLIMGALLIVFIVTHLEITRRQGGVLAEAVHQRFRNLELLRVVDSKRREAEQANRAKTRFLAAASHDLRQPMHALALFSDSLKETLEFEEQLTLHERMEESIHATHELLDSLLDISRLDAGIIRKQIRVVDLPQLLEGLADRFRPQAQALGLALETEFSPCRVRSDPVLLEDILHNLLSNALKYTLSGKVRLCCRREEKHALVEVADTGSGIPEPSRELIFEEFYQGGNPERDRSKGLGLGLPIVRRLCRLLGHELQLESREGIGSVFTLRLEATDAQAEAIEVWGLDGTDNMGLRILVIDDEPAILKGMQHLLQGWGCEVLVAESAEAAVGLLTGGRFHPQLIIADYRLREGRNGTEAIRMVQGVPGCEDAQGMIITGDTAPERLREAESAGNTLLHKPVSPMRLRVVLRHLMAERSR